MSTDAGDVAYWSVNVFILNIMFEPSTISRQFAYDDGKPEKLMLDDIMERNLTFEGDLDVNFVPAIFQLVGDEYQEYVHNKLFVRNGEVTIKKDKQIYFENYLKIEVNHKGALFYYYYPMQITTCEFTPYDNLQPIRITGGDFTFGATRGQNFYEGQKISRLFRAAIT